MVAATRRAPPLRFTGAAYLRYRLVLAILSGRTVRFDEIRQDDHAAPGLSPAEISFIRLVDKITNGSAIEINETGTTFRFRPGILVGQTSVRMSHDCHQSRPVAYYLEPLLMLAPFCKKPLDITLRGPTHGPTDQSADSMANVTVPLVRRLTLGTPVNPEVVVVKRALASSCDTYGGGRGGIVIFRCGILSSKIAPVELVESGFVKRVRGIAIANKVSPSCITQMVDKVRSVLNRFTPDVYIHTDHGNSAEGGAGYGLGLVAETTEGCLLGSDWTTVDMSYTPGLIAESAINMILDQIAHGGCIDSTNAPLALLYCALADSDVTRLRLGRFTEQNIVFLRDLKMFFGVIFKLRAVESTESSDDSDYSDSDEKRFDANASMIGEGIIVSCVGVGLDNTARQRF